MDSVQKDVLEFHRKLGILIGRWPEIRRPDLRIALMKEEMDETIDAIERGDLVEAIDGMCDVLATVYGTAVEFGVDLQPFWNEVHRSNMDKVNIKEVMKAVKPKGWKPPAIRDILERIERGETLANKSS